MRKPELCPHSHHSWKPVTAYWWTLNTEGIKWYYDICIKCGRWREIREWSTYQLRMVKTENGFSFKRTGRKDIASSFVKYFWVFPSEWHIHRWLKYASYWERHRSITLKRFKQRLGTGGIWKNNPNTRYLAVRQWYGKTKDM